VKPILVLGIGSPFGGDRAGWQVVERLKTLFDETEKVPEKELELACVDRPGAELIAFIRNREQVVLVDALIGDGAPGTQHLIKIDDLLADRPALSTHGFGVAEALAMAQVLGALPKRTAIFGITVDPLSEPAKEHVDVLAHRIFEYLNTNKKRAAERREQGRSGNSEGAIPQ